MQLSILKTSTLDVFSTFGPIYRRPETLFIQSKSGDVSLLNELPERGLAIVGSRLPQKRSVDFLSQTLAELKNSGLIIVSGFARGIDAKAHELAIENGLRTIALLGCGIERNYPAENANLRNSILDSGGLIVSQFPPESQPLPGNFFERNGTIAGFSKAVWVVEAAEISGTLNTAKWASDLNRDLYATSCFPTDPYYQGNMKLLSQKHSDRYPVAQSFFGAESFTATWRELSVCNRSQTTLSPAKFAKSDLQRWVLELQTLTGKCKIQALMELAAQKGYTLGKFYHLFEAEIDSGQLRHDANGIVEMMGGGKANSVELNARTPHR